MNQDVWNIQNLHASTFTGKRKQQRKEQGRTLEVAEQLE